MSKFISCVGDNHISTLVHVDTISHISIGEYNGKNRVYSTYSPMEISFKELSLIGKAVDTDSYFELYFKDSTPRSMLIFKKHVSHIINNTIFLSTNYALEADEADRIDIVYVITISGLVKVVDNSGIMYYINKEAINLITIDNVVEEVMLQMPTIQICISLSEYKSLNL